MSPHSSTGYDDFVEGQSYLVFAFGGMDEVGQCSPPIALSSAGPVLALFYLIQYFLFIPIIIGGIVFAVWKKRKVDNNSRQISINKDIIRKKIINPFLGSNPLSILQIRLAKGEISLEEFERLEKKLINKF